MHFMIGRIFMNQESKVINVHLEKRENKEYLVFGFEEVAEVCLNAVSYTHLTLPTNSRV